MYPETDVEHHILRTADSLSLKLKPKDEDVKLLLKTPH